MTPLKVAYIVKVCIHGKGIQTRISEILNGFSAYMFLIEIPCEDFHALITYTISNIFGTDIFYIFCYFKVLITMYWGRYKNL